MRINQHAFARTIRADGKLTINHEDDSVSRSLAGQRVTCWVNIAEKCFDIWQPGGHIKSVPIKGEASPGDAFRGVCGADARRKHARSTGRICAPIPGSPKVACGPEPQASAARRVQTRPSRVSSSWCYLPLSSARPVAGQACKALQAPGGRTAF